MKNKYIFSAALLTVSMVAQAQTSINFETEDYKAIGVYDQWEESPFRTGKLAGNAAVCDNPDTGVDPILGVAINTSEKVVAFQRSRFGGNAYGVRIDLKEPFRLTKDLQYVHVMTYLKDKPEDSRMMVIGLGKRVEKSWSWQSGKEEQFWALTTSKVKAKEGWQDVVASFKGFSYSKEENENSGIDIYSLVIVPDVRSPHADASDWVAYFDNIVVDKVADKRFNSDKYAVTYDAETKITRNDRNLNKIGLTVDGKTTEFRRTNKSAYNDFTADSLFSVKTGQSVRPTFGYTGAFMNAYVYVDWSNDGIFSHNVESNGVPAAGSEVVSFNAVQLNGTWYKSDGTTVSNGNNIAAGVPPFTVPDGTVKGFYRMRYKVDWNSLDPAGHTTIVENAGGIVDVTLDVHGETVSVSASQLNGDILLKEGQAALQNYQAAYGEPLTVLVAPYPGFVQNGFKLKYGYNVFATEQQDENGNPNWIAVDVPVTAIAADGTYTIPGEYIRGGQVSIVGDMQQTVSYTVTVEGAPEGQGGVSYLGVLYGDGDVINSSQYFSISDVEPVQLDDYTYRISYDNVSKTVLVTYTKTFVLSSLSNLHNDRAYYIKSSNNEGYLVWNHEITDQYVSIRGVKTYGSGEPTNATAKRVYAQEVDPTDITAVWQILKEGNSYYLYQPAKKNYVTRVVRDYKFTSTKTALDGIRDNGDGTFAIHAGGGYSDGSQNYACIVTNESLQPVRNWTYSDHGSTMLIIWNPEINVEDITTAIDGLPASFSRSDKSQGVYNAQGQKLKALPKEGFVVVDGKKRIIHNR